MQVDEVARNSMTNGGPVDAALAEYLLRRERGESVDLTALIAAYPGCEGEVRKFVAQERNVNRVMAAVSPAATPTQDLAGRALGDFRLLRIIGRGGMGIVWEADQISLRRRVAVKLLPGAMCADPRYRTRFQNEARILAQLEHPNIVNVIAVGEEADTYYFAMQYIDGMTADELLRIWNDNPRLGETRLHVAESLRDSDEVGAANENAELPRWASCDNPCERYRLCARIAHDIASGLAHAHACGVLHRDVKPSNILLDKSGTARLTDFGLARMYGDATLTTTGAVLGTLRYASPEQLSGTHNTVDERSDVYSLGATLWEMVTGNRLFAAEDHNSVITHVLKVEAPRPSSRATGLPRDLETIIIRAMAKEPTDRYASAQTLAEDLQRFLDGRPIQARPFSLGERAFRWANRNRSLATTAVASLVVLALVAVAASALILRANSQTATALHESRQNEELAKQSAVAAEASERKTRELLYAADMALAGAAWKKSEPTQARMILDRYAQPKTNDSGTMKEDIRGFEWHFLDRQTRPQSEVIFQNDKEVYFIAFMRDGKEFYTAGQDGIVRWHDANNGKVLRSVDARQGEINGVSYNPSRTMFATAGDDGSAKIWNATDLSLLHSLKACEGKCYFSEFLPDDELLITGGHSKVHRLYNAASGELIREYMSPDITSGGTMPATCWDAHVGKSGGRFWTTTDRCRQGYEGVYEWNFDTGGARRISNDLYPLRLLLDRSERFLFVNTQKGQIRILDAKTGEEAHSIRLDNNLQALTLSPDERRLLAGDRNGQVYAWAMDLDKPSRVVTSKEPEKLAVHASDVYEIAFSPDGKSIFTAGRDGSVRRTRSEMSMPQVREIPWLRNQGCIPVPGTGLVVTTKPLAIRERSTGTLVRTLSTNDYSALATSGDGKLVAAGSATHIGVWNLESGEAIVNLKLKRRSILKLDLSADDSLLLIISDDDRGRRVDTINISSGEQLQHTGRGSNVYAAYSCTNNGLVMLDYTSSQITCWNMQDRKIRWQTDNPVRGGASAISPDCTRLLKATRRSITLYNCDQGDVRYQAVCDYSIDSVSFSGDGHSFVVGGTEGQLSVWNTFLGQPLFELANVGTSVESIQPLDYGFLVSTRRVKDGHTYVVWYELCPENEAAK